MKMNKTVLAKNKCQRNVCWPSVTITFKLLVTRKGVPELRGPASVWVLYRQKLSKEPGRQVQIYLRRVFLPPPSPVLANIHSILAYDVPGTEDVGLPTKFRFNVGPALQPIAGSMLVNRLWCWPNTNLSSGLLYTLSKHVAFNQCFFNVDPQSSTLAHHWNSIGWL